MEVVLVSERGESTSACVLLFVVVANSAASSHAAAAAGAGVLGPVPGVGVMAKGPHSGVDEVRSDRLPYYKDNSCSLPKKSSRPRRQRYPTSSGGAGCSQGKKHH
jgi:hypothetical protein